MVAYPRRGTFATGVDIADLAGISEIRAQLEPLAARRAAERASRATRAELADLASKTETLDVGTLDRTELMRWDMTVHRAIYRAAGNSAPRRRADPLRQPGHPDLLPVPGPAAHRGRARRRARRNCCAPSRRSSRPSRRTGPRARPGVRASDPGRNLTSGRAEVLCSSVN